MDKDTSSKTDVKRPLVKRILKGLAIILAVIAVIVAAGAVAIALMIRMEHQQKIRHDAEELNRDIAALKSGTTHSVYLYDTQNTDSLLERLCGMPEVEELMLEMTDVSDEGIRHVSTLPNLRKLVIYCVGYVGVGDEGLAYLRGMKSIETLELVNTGVTDNGLKVLQELPNLRSCVLYRGSWGPKCLTDAGLVHLERLRELKRLELGGRWASPEAIAALRTKLPNCTIVIDDREGSTQPTTNPSPAK